MEILNDNNFDVETKEGIFLVDFYADWCAPCHMVSPIIEEVEKELSDVRVVKINTEESPELSSRFKIRSIPTFIVLKNGVEVEKKSGAIMDKNFYIKLIANSTK